MELQEIKQELKPLILSSLRIAEIGPAELKDDQALLGGDLEIDSIDILQLILEIEKRFGIRLVTGRFDRDAWQTVSSLAATIQEKMREQGQG